MTPIGQLASCFVRLNGTPRNGGICPHARASLTLCCPDPLASLDGIADFSHVWLVFGFHQNKKVGAAKPKVAPPKLGGGRVGVFSSRAPYRPNSIGLSLARLDRVEGATLHLSGLDLVDGTPVYDIKPYIPAYDSPRDGDPTRLPGWLEAAQAPVQQLRVIITPEARHQIDTLEAHLVAFSTADEAVLCLIEMLASDPRSVYRKTKCEGSEYPLILDSLHIISAFDDTDRTVTVHTIELLADTDYAQAPVNVNNLGSIDRGGEPISGKS
jgi:tRNA-Thr(GGU) m(6)t(6)A37 methyltransferase TsaA